MTTLSVPRIRGAIDTEGPTLANFGGFGGRMALRDGIGAPTLRTRAVSAETAMDDFRVSQAMKKVTAPGNIRVTQPQFGLMFMESALKGKSIDKLRQEMEEAEAAAAKAQSDHILELAQKGLESDHATAALNSELDAALKRANQDEQLVQIYKAQLKTEKENLVRTFIGLVAGAAIDENIAKHDPDFVRGGDKISSIRNNWPATSLASISSSKNERNEFFKKIKDIRDVQAHNFVIRTAVKILQLGIENPTSSPFTPQEINPVIALILQNHNLKTIEEALNCNELIQGSLKGEKKVSTWVNNGLVTFDQSSTIKAPVTGALPCVGGSGIGQGIGIGSAGAIGGGGVNENGSVVGVGGSIEGEGAGPATAINHTGVVFQQPGGVSGLGHQSAGLTWAQRLRMNI